MFSDSFNYKAIINNLFIMKAEIVSHFWAISGQIEGNITCLLRCHNGSCLESGPPVDSDGHEYSFDTPKKCLSRCESEFEYSEARNSLRNLNMFRAFDGCPKNINCECFRAEVAAYVVVGARGDKSRMEICM